MSVKVAWITWESQIRNRSMASALGIPLIELHSSKGRLARYLALSWQTLQAIKSRQLTHLFVQNPSIMLAFIAALAKPFFKFKLCIDSHNSGVYPLENRYQLVTWINKCILKSADLVIVSNKSLGAQLSAWGVKNLDIFDPIPSLGQVSAEPPIAAPSSYPRPYFLFICSWAADEPYWEVMQAAKSLPEYDLYISGAYKKVLTDEQINKLPDNIKLLGFVTEEDYVFYFANCLGAIDLTTREDCLVCGAYEAIALHKPSLLSDTRVNRHIFAKGFVYSQNTCDAIVKGLIELAGAQSSLTEEIVDLQREMNMELANRIAQLNEVFLMIPKVSTYRNSTP